MSHIILQDVSVDFPIYGVGKLSLKKELVRLTTGGLIKHDTNKLIMVRGINRLSINFCKGDRVGLIGHNGAGKSTLLKLLAGIYHPSEGKLDINGHIASLLDIMMGMEQESTGYENIVMRGMLNGLTRKEIKRKQTEIAEFTGLGDYLAMPVRTYSAGMQVRLAFAIATSVYSEILLLDEVVGAGDNEFLEKAKARMNDLINQSDIVVLASHDPAMIRSICNKVLWLNAGSLVYFGDDVAGTLDRYLKHIV